MKRNIYLFAILGILLGAAVSIGGANGSGQAVAPNESPTLNKTMDIDPSHCQDATESQCGGVGSESSQGSCCGGE